MSHNQRVPDDERLAAIEQRLALIEQRLSISAPAPAPPPPPAPPAPAKPAKSVESLIGAHWLNRVGIAAILVGAAFFLKLAIDNEWIGPAMRVGIGAVIGIALLVASDIFHRRGHRLFAHSLEVVAVGVLYLSIWAASQTYTLIPNSTAFGAMTVVTIALVALALRHQSEFLAGLALTGGFLTPVLLSTGQNREMALFSYVAILDVAALILVTLRPWIRALAVAFFGTMFLYIGWHNAFYSKAQESRTIAFLSLFLVLFASMPLLRRWHDGAAGSAALLLLPFFNAFAYFGEVSWIVQDSGRLAKYAIALAGFFLVIAFAARLRDDEDRFAAHLAIALGFVTIAIPLQFHAVWVSVGWLTEAAVLLLLSQRLAGDPARAFRILASFALGCAIFRMFFYEHFHPEHLLLNIRALCYLMAVGIFSGIALSSKRFCAFATTSLHALALIGLTLEVNDFVTASKVARDFSWSALWMVYGAGLMIAGFRRASPLLRWLALILLGLTVGKVFFYDLSALERTYRILSFIALGILLLAISFAYQRKWITVPEDHADSSANART